MLEVGDIVYKMYHGDPTDRYKIERVTKTMAISDNVRFKRESSNGVYVYITPRPEYISSTTYWIANADLDVKFKRRLVITAIRDIKWEKLTSEALEEILTIAKKNS